MQPTRPPAASFHVMVKPVGPLCNLDCSYCFYLKKEELYPPKSGVKAWTMSEEALEALIVQTIAAQPGGEVHFAWQGGEPTLLGVPFFERVVELQKLHGGGNRIHNALQTNGVLLDDEWGRFLATRRFLVGLSIDGPAFLHDRWRVDKGGNASHSRVLAGLEVLRRHQVDFNTLTVVHRDSACHPLEVYHYLKEIGSQAIQFIPAVERLPDGTVAPWSVLAQDWGTFLCQIFDEWIVEDVGRLQVQLFEVALESWLNRPSSLCFFRPTCGAAVALEHNGDLYSCDHFVQPENRLGNLLRQSMEWMVNSPQQRQFGRDKLETLPAQCLACDVRFACHGECPKNRFITTQDGESGLNYLCAGYLKFFRHIDPAMKYMAEQIRAGRNPNTVSQHYGAKRV